MHRVVIKIGTALLTNTDFSLNRKLIDDLTEQIAKLKKSNFEIVLVTSGAVACGRSEVKIENENKNIPFRQALSAVGQPILMNTYHYFFKKYNIVTAQALLTNYDFSHKENFIVMSNTFDLLLKIGVIPVVNENDVISYSEIKFGDNDTLAAKVASMVSADTLILLTNVNGLYTSDPTIDKNAKLIKEVKEINGYFKSLAKDTKSKNALGGMASKLNAAEYVLNSGIKCIITSGKEKNILERLMIKKEKIGTCFIPSLKKTEVKKRWLRAGVKRGCQIFVDDGALNALKNQNASLLPSGIMDVKGEFNKGEIVSILSLKKVLIGYGIVNYSSKDIKKIKGRHSDKIAEILGKDTYKKVIHRDHLVVV